MVSQKILASGLACAIALQSVPTTFAAERRVPDGTRIAVRLMEQISSATMKENDPVNFAVVEDVTIDGEVVIKQGTPVRGVIVEAAAKRRLGRAGKMMYTVNETKAIDRGVISLRAVQDRRGDSHMTSTAVTTTAVAVFVPVAAPFFLLRKGKDVVVPEGTRVDVFVDGDHTIATAPAPDPVPQTVTARATGTTAAGAPATAQAGTVATVGAMTNADVVLLHKAGLSADVILAKIMASPAAFSVESPDLVALKKAGVPEQVITAMVAAR